MIVFKSIKSITSFIASRCPLRVRLHQTGEGTEEYGIFDYSYDDGSLNSQKKIFDFKAVCKEIEMRTEQKTNKVN